MAREWRVSPAYDLPATVPYGDYTLAIPIMGQRENVSRKAMLAFGEELGLPRAFAERELDKLLDKTEDARTDIRSSGRPFDQTRFHQFDRHLRARRRNLRA